MRKHQPRDRRLTGRKLILLLVKEVDERVQEMNHRMLELICEKGLVFLRLYERMPRRMKDLPVH